MFVFCCFLLFLDNRQNRQHQNKKKNKKSFFTLLRLLAYCWCLCDDEWRMTSICFSGDNVMRFKEKPIRSALFTSETAISKWHPTPTNQIRASFTSETAVSRWHSAPTNQICASHFKNSCCQMKHGRDVSNGNANAKNKMRGARLVVFARRWQNFECTI